MHKIILIQINDSKDHSEKILPLGILSVGSALKKSGFEVELLNINEKEIEQKVEYIIREKPLFVGLSVMTGSQTKHSAELSEKIKAGSDLKIIWGGIHPSLLPRQCLAENYVDFIVIGEGEETFSEFTKEFTGTKNFREVLGLGWKKGEEIFINSERPLIADLDQWPLDYRLINLDNYIYKLDKYERVIAYKTSRGCPFNCAFCYNRQFNKNKWRAWSIEHVVSDIEFLKKEYKIEAIKFYDDNFFVDKSRALEILRRINLPSHLEVRSDMIDDSLAKELKERKVFDLLIGVESGSDRILKLLNKNTTVDRILSAVRSLAKYDVPASYSAIVGLPTETEEEFESTVALLYQIYKIHSRAAFTLGVYLPYPGSLMYDFALQQGFSPPQTTKEWGNVDRFRKGFSSPWVDADKVWRIREYFKLIKLKLGPISKWFEWRIRHRFFLWPLDIYFIEWLAGIAIEEKSWFGKLLRRGYNFVKLRN